MNYKKWTPHLLYTNRQTYPSKSTKSGGSFFTIGGGAFCTIILKFLIEQMVVPRHGVSFKKEGGLQCAYSMVDLVKSFRSLQWVVSWFLFNKNRLLRAYSQIFFSTCSGSSRFAFTNLSWATGKLCLQLFFFFRLRRACLMVDWD